MVRNGDPLGDMVLPAVDDEVFVALADRNRRIALYYLRWRRRVDVDSLADVVTGWRHAGRRRAASRADRDRVRAALLGQHLPILVDADLVEVDGETRTVAIRPLSEPVRALIDFAYETEGGTNAPS